MTSWDGFKRTAKFTIDVTDRGRSYITFKVRTSALNRYSRIEYYVEKFKGTDVIQPRVAVSSIVKVVYVQVI